MKHGIHILFWMLIAALSSCTDDEIIDVPEPQPQTGIVIRLSAGDLEQTRTDLTSQANLHHVQSVYAILYKENADKSDYDYVTCDDLNWSPKDSSSYGEAQAQAKVLDLPNDINLEAGNYTVLCVGLDDKSGDTYGLTPENMQSFKTLSEAKATLAQGKGKEDIAKSELFAGWNQFHFAPDSLNIVDVEMKRRVAGVICYLTDVPYQLTQDNKTYRITSVELWLYTKQNTGIKLCREEITGGEYPEDFGDTSGGDLEGSELIGQQSMINSGFGVNADKTLYTRDKQTIKTTDGREVTIKENSILMGAYLIPIDYDATKSTIITDANLKKDVTLQVALRGVEVASIDEDITDEKIKGAQIVRSFPAFNDDIDLDIDNSSGTPVATPSYTYPIRPNIIYHIGNKPSDEEEGTPESLAGTKVNIVAEEWTNQEINVEFPSVPIMATMELLDENDQPYNTDSYIFDCIGIDDQMYEDFYEGYPNTKRLKLRIHASILKEQWHLNVATECKDQTMLYMYNDETGIYDPLTYNNPTPEEYGADYFDIYIIMTDYVEENGPDKRSVKLELKTGDLVYPMTITQYNALFVDAENWKLAVSRYDWGCKRNLNDGSIDTNQPYLSSGWGFTSSVQATIFPGVANDELDGRVNYKAAKSSADYRDHWDAFYSSLGCAMYCGAKKKLLINNEGRKRTGEDLIWYVPAFDEMESALNSLKKDLSKANMEQNRKYWTASAASLDGIVYTAWNIFVNTDNNVDFDGGGAIGVPRKSLYPFRQVCRIDND